MRSAQCNCESANLWSVDSDSLACGFGTVAKQFFHWDTCNTLWPEIPGAPASTAFNCTKCLSVERRAIMAILLHPSIESKWIWWNLMNLCSSCLCFNMVYVKHVRSISLDHIIKVQLRQIWWSSSYTFTHGLYLVHMVGPRNGRIVCLLIMKISWLEANKGAHWTSWNLEISQWL